MGALLPTRAEDLTLARLSSLDRRLLREFVAHEAVVPVQSERDLQRRLRPDRRLYAFVDDAGDPALFLNVALTPTFPRSLDALLAGDRSPDVPRFAIFYGITRANERGRGHGGELIVRAAADLQEHVPSLRVFASLSPLVGFRSWLQDRFEQLGRPELDEALDVVARHRAAGMVRPRAVRALENAARAYVGSAEAPGDDPVAQFHLRNGASVRAVMAGADCSWRGLGRSYGVMASYQYIPTGVSLHALPADDAVERLVRELDFVE